MQFYFQSPLGRLDQVVSYHDMRNFDKKNLVCVWRTDTDKNRKALYTILKALSKHQDVQIIYQTSTKYIKL